MSSSTSDSESGSRPFYRAYLAVLAAAFALTSGLASLFNWAQDPFALFRHPAPPVYFTHARLAKAKAVERIGPSAIMLGTSRAEIAFDPEHPGFRGLQAYNLSLGGANLHEMFLYLQHAHAINPLRLVVMEAEFFSFNAKRKPTPDFDPSVLLSSSDGTLDALAKGVRGGRHLLSYDMFAASTRMLVRKVEPKASYHMPDGRVEHVGGLAQVDAQGHYAMFGPPLLSMMGSKEVYAQHSVTDASTGTSTLQEFARLLRFCRENRIDLRVVITPSHALLYEAIRRAGSWAAFEGWKRSLLDIAIAEAAGHGGVAAFPVWDFSGYNSITTEALPQPGEKGRRMRWFWEAVHITVETGNLVLARVLQYPDAGLPADFGHQLTPDSMSRVEGEVRRAREVYARQNTALIEAVLR